MTFYRGTDIETFNQEAFAENAILGEYHPIIEVDLPDGVRIGDYKYQDSANFEDFIVDKREVAITGGLTDRFTSATKFTKTTFPPGLVLKMDETNIPADVEAIEYDIDWFDAHPGVLAHVTTLRDGEIREDGRITALARADSIEEVMVDEWRREEIQNEATANRYTTEREVVAFGEEIWLDDSVTAMVMVLGTTGTSPYQIRHSLGESPSYRTSLGRVKDAETRDVVAGEDEYKKQAELLYDEVDDLIAFDEAPLYLVAVESRNDIRSEDGRIDPENFRFVYNGRSFDEDYSRNSALLGGV